MQEDLHSGHRQRMWTTYDTQGAEGFNDHQILEMLLFCVLPRIDTNPLAHELIRRFGSFSGVLEASPTELMQVKGIGERTARLLSFLPTVSRVYLRDKNKWCATFDTVEKVGDYATRLYVGVKTEQIYAMLFDSKMKLLDSFRLSEGSISSAVGSSRAVAEHALRVRATHAVILHNHPGGLAVPSPEDYSFTSSMKMALGLLDICLVGHFIVAGEEYYPILMNQEKEPLGRESMGRSGAIHSADLTEKG